MGRVPGLLVGGLLVLAPPLAGQAVTVPLTDAAWQDLRDRLERNPFHLAAADRDTAMAIVITALETRDDGVRWAAYGPGICAARGPGRDRAGDDEGHSDPQASRRCLERVLRALAARDSTEVGVGMVRSMLTQPLAEALVELGDLDAADSVAAEELVRAAAEASFVRGNAQYTMNQVRGRVALRRGDRAAAVECLRLAGLTEGSPQLSSFGPRLVLARELLEAGERQAVREFLETVRGFWTGPEARATLDAALATIDAGGVPSGRRWR